MQDFYYITATFVHPRKGRKYRRGDDIIEKYTFTITDTVDINAELSLCIGDKQVQRSVRYNFLKDENINRQELIEFVECVKDNYGPNKRNTALISPENYGKVFLKIGTNEYLFTRDNPDLERLLTVMRYGYLRTMLVKEKLAFLQSSDSKEPSCKGILPEKKDSAIKQFVNKLIGSTHSVEE